MHAGSHCWGDLPRRLSSVSFEQARGARWIGERWWEMVRGWRNLKDINMSNMSNLSPICRMDPTGPSVNRNKSTNPQGQFSGTGNLHGKIGKGWAMYLPQNVTEQSWTVEWLWTSKSCWLLWSLQGSCLRLCLRAPRLNHVHIWSAVISCDQHGPRIQQKVSTLSFSGQSRFSLILKSWGLHFGGVTLFAQILAIALICSYPPYILHPHPHNLAHHPNHRDRHHRRHRHHYGYHCSSLCLSLIHISFTHAINVAPALKLIHVDPTLQRKRLLSPYFHHIVATRWIMVNHGESHAFRSRIGLGIGLQRHHSGHSASTMLLWG